MTCITIVLAVAALIAGLLSAWYWLKASRVEVTPLWAELGMAEPAIHDQGPGPLEYRVAQGGKRVCPLKFYCRAMDCNGSRFWLSDYVCGSLAKMTTFIFEYGDATGEQVPGQWLSSLFGKGVVFQKHKYSVCAVSMGQSLAWEVSRRPSGAVHVMGLIRG